MIKQNQDKMKCDDKKMHFGFVGGSFSWGLWFCSFLHLWGREESR